MTQLRRVRALHLAPRCTLHTYSIGRAASQRNNIATIHHTTAVNKTSGSFSAALAPPPPPFLAVLLHFFPRLLRFIFTIYSPTLLPGCTTLLVASTLRLPTPFRPFDSRDSNRVFATSAYFYPTVSSLPFFRSFSTFCRPFLRVSFSPYPSPALSARSYIFSVSLFVQFHVHPSPLHLFLSFLLSTAFSLFSLFLSPCLRHVGKKCHEVRAD